MKLRRLATLSFAATFLLPAAANAACAQTDLTGSWQAYSVNANNANNGGSTYWTRCKLVINGSGGIANTTCTSPFATAPLTLGHATLSVASTCTFTAQFTINGTLNKVLHGTLSRDKEGGQGVGTYAGGLFFFNMTKL